MSTPDWVWIARELANVALIVGVCLMVAGATQWLEGKGV